MPRTKSRKLGMKKKGFSMMEAVISVFVMAVGLVATINLMVSGLNHSTDSRDHIVASQLAQEGVELVRNLRDNNWADLLIANSFDNNNFPNGDRNNCKIDKDSNVKSCAGGADHKKLYYKNGFYVHDSAVPAEDTRFQRKIELDFDNPSMSDLTVTGIVIWGRANNDFPAVCDVANNCVYTQSVLTKWGE